ncbi:MAG TPA: helix-hairpin-helix domain-containing protein [Bacteroidales bacterium]|nr:helix-hairpin-helix domain-containing protein [Bacteroidales bacterium]HPS18276.1 helix-hairpin-helix domain-containing protein [Bacteroidales bacterium]
MKKQLKYFFKISYFLTLLFAFNVSAQEVDTIETGNEDVFQKVESIAEQTDAELDYTELLEDMDYYRNHPINLNKTDEAELKKLFILNDIQINNLLEHIAANGKLISLYELQGISGFDIATINKLLPYVYVSGDVNNRHFSFKEMLDNSSSQFIIRYQKVLEEQQGFSAITDSALSESPNSRYVGSPEKIFAKYRFTYYNNISFGITAEKDAGEEFFKGSQKNGFDFYSAHFFIRDFGFIKALAVGDYQVQYGQGLTLWSGLGFGKSSDAMGIKKNGQGIKPYTSSDENRFMRGIATTIGNKNIELSLFLSNKKIDGNITENDTSTDEVISFSSLQETGLHSTPNELANKDAINELIYGAHISGKIKKINIGATAFKSKYSAMLQREFQLYDQFEFSGNENSNIGIDYSYIFRNMNLFGELSRSENGGKAFMNGCLLSLDKKISLSFLYRNYEKEYQSLYSSAFAENSNLANEKGIFSGFIFKPVHAVSITAYIDNVSFSWLKYRIDEPSKALDYLFQLNWAPSKKTEMYFLYRQKNKNLNSSGEDVLFDNVEPTLKQNYRFNAVYKVNSKVTLKNRVEFLSYKVSDEAPQQGYIIYQDINFKKMKSPFSFSVRYALFDCDTYDSRIYAFENDVLYSYSVPAFYNKGARFYITTHYSVCRNFDIWLRFAQTYYDNKTLISSGLTQIAGNKKSEIKVQLRIKF